ncbi:MAG: hypothetical protein AAF744_13805 [Pseudomonadota bacterium]
MRVWIAYTIAFALAAGTAWFTQSLLVAALFAPAFSATALLANWALPPLSGMSVFALIFGLMMGVQMGLRFWAAALLLCFGVYAVMLAGIFVGIFTVVEGTIAALALTFILGGVLARRLVS